MSPTAADAPVPAVQATGLRKAWAGAQALQGVDFRLAPGEVRALLGRNGAGKSTLVKILSGAVTPDAGLLHLGGERVLQFSPRHAKALGVATVHQELSLVPELSVAENVLLGRWQEHRRGPFLDRAALHRRAAQVLQEFGVQLDPAARVRRLSIAQQQLVEIARGLALRPRLLILDEPTSSLAASEVDLLLRTLLGLAERGVAVVYVSHRMDEIQRVAHSVTVLRDGHHVDTLPIAQASTADIVRLMTGGTEAAARGPAVARTLGRVALRVEGLTTPARLRDVSLELREGEIVGLAGLQGAGRTELLRAVYGLDVPNAGRIEVFGRAPRAHTPRGMLREGVGLAPEDRKKEGLVLDMGIARNLVLSALHKVVRRGLLSRRRQSRLAADVKARMAIRQGHPEDAVRTLSGGNQQKVVLGKCLLADAKVLLLDEPTRGVDIAAKLQIYALLRELAGEGRAVLVASSELEELMLLCDRLMLMKDGRVVAERRVEDTCLDEVMALAMGGAPAKETTP